MSLAEQALASREFDTVLAPMNVYCFRCNLIIRKGALVHRYDGATFTHDACPNTPHKTFAAHKYGGN